MPIRSHAGRLALALALLLLAGVPRMPQAQTAPPTPASAAPTPPPSPVSGIRNKLSAGDLLSAESVLEVHREKNGEDGAWLQGLSWLARGAFLMGDMEKAERYAKQVRDECARRMANGAALDTSHDLEIALGAAIETDAQRLERTKGRNAAAQMVRGAAFASRISQLRLAGVRLPAGCSTYVPAPLR